VRSVFQVGRAGRTTLARTDLVFDNNDKLITDFTVSPASSDSSESSSITSSKRHLYGKRFFFFFSLPIHFLLSAG
jgi:hypothetical protein